MIFRKTIFTLFSAFIFLLVMPGCSTGYLSSKSFTAAPDYPKAITKAKKNNSSFILHSGVNVYTVTALELDKPKQNVHVQLNKLDSLQVVKVPDPKREISTSGKRAASAGEMHFFMKDSVSYLLEEPYTIPLEKVARIDVVAKS